MSVTWEIEVCDRFGANVVALPNAVPISAAERRNESRTMTWRIGVKDAGAIAADLANCVIRRDARIRRNGVVWLWGPNTAIDIDRRYVTVQTSDPFWHLHDLSFGPNRYQYIANPDGAAGLTGWSATGLDTFAVDTADFVRTNPGTGTGQSFLLAVSAPGADAFMEQSFSVTSNVDQATAFVVAGWAKVEEFVGPALAERGLFVSRAGDPTPYWAPITAAVKVGKWVRYSVEVVVPANTTDTLTVRPYGVQGRTRWGGLSCRVYESTGTPQHPEDAIHPITRVIDLAQDPAWGYPPLNITKAGGLTGSLIEIHYQFHEGGNVGSALLDYARKGICDFGFTYPDPATRTLEVFSPRRGVFRPDVLLDINPSGSLADFRYRIDGRQTFSAVRVRGAGEGADSEFAWAFDYSATGGIRRERVEDAPSDSSVADLDRLASEGLARDKAPVRVPTLTTHPRSGDLLDQITVGDSALCRIDHGCLQENAVRRIEGWDLDVRRNSLTLEVAA